MKIYHLQYIDEADLTQHEFFSNKQAATKRQNQLQKICNQEHEKWRKDTDSLNDNRLIKQVFGVSTMDAEISAAGILMLLNSYFSETQ